MSEGKEIILRPVRREDLPLMLEWREESPAGLRTGHRPLTELNQEEFFKKISFDEKIAVFTICLGGKPIGYVQLYPIDWKNRKAEAGIIIGKEFRGMGHASEALRLLLDYGFNTLNLKRIYAEIYSPLNDESIKLFERAGFKKEGVLRSTHYWAGRYYDSIIFSILDEEWPS